MYNIKDNSTGAFLTSWFTNGSGEMFYNWGSQQDAHDFETQNQEFLEAMGGSPGQFVFIGKNPKPR